MEYLNRMRRVACRLALSRFAAAHDGLYALGAYPGPSVDDGMEWSFATQPNVRVEEAFAAALTDNGAALLAGRFLRRIQKSDRNPWKGRISTGRAKNCDVIIRHPSVSKLHAHFLTSPGEDPHRENGYDLKIIDAASRNGTQHNGMEVSSDEPLVVRAGDRIIIGEVTLELMEPKALYHKLRDLFPTDEVVPTG
jgi:hypothetical protein